jgi:hypothetical protein
MSVSARERGEGEYESYDGSRSPHTSRWRCARVAPSRATKIIHAATINANAKIMRIVVRSRQETRPLDVKMASYHRSYQLRFNHLGSCTSASAYISHDQQGYEKGARVFFFLFCNRMQHAPCDDPSRIRAGPGWPACGWRADVPRALRGRAAIPRARRQSVGRSCVACPGRPCGISAEKENRKGRRCGSAIAGGKGKGGEVSSGEWRTLMEVKESWMMPSNARQLLRPSWSFSCADGQRRSMP